MSVSNEFAQVIKSYAAFVNDGKKLDTVFYDGMFNLGFAADTFMYRTDMVWPTEDQMEMHNILKLAQMNNVLLKSDMAAEDDILDRVDEETEIGELKGIKWAYGDEPHLVEFQIYNEGGSIRKYNMTHPGREYDSEGHLIPLPGSEASGKEGAAVEEVSSDVASAVEAVATDVASAVEEVSSEVEDMMEEPVIEEVSEDVLEAGEAVSSLDAMVSDLQNGSLDFSASGNVNLESDIEKHLDFDESLLDEPDDSIFNLSESASFEFDESEDSFDSEDNFEVEELEIEAPVVEAVAEPVVEAVTEPVVESVAEPAVEAVAEPAVESVAEKVAQMNSSELENALALAKGKIAELSEKVKDYDFLLGKVSDLTAKVTSLESYKSQAEDKIHSLEEKLSAATGKHKELEEKLLSVSKQAEDAKNQAVSQVKELAKAQAKTQKEEFTKKMSQMKEMLSAMENQFFSNADE